MNKTTHDAFINEMEKLAIPGGFLRHTSHGLRNIFGAVGSAAKKSSKAIREGYAGSQRSAKAMKHRIGMEARLGWTTDPVAKKVRSTDVKRMARSRAEGAPSTKGVDVTPEERVRLRGILGFKPTAKPKAAPKKPAAASVTPKNEPKAKTPQPAKPAAAEPAEAPQKSISLAAKLGLGAGATGLSAGGAYYYTAKKQQQPKPVGHTYRR